MQRGSGILMHISSLPSPYGIGTMGKAAYEFIDFLERAGQKYWQILPISPTGYGDSPYQSYSTFAGNPYFIDLDMLASDGNLHSDEYKYCDWGHNPCAVDYGKIYENKFRVLKSAYLADIDEIRDKLNEFRSREAYWVENYAMYMALKYDNGLKPYWEWEDDLKFRSPEALSRQFERLGQEIEYWVYIQYRFFEQWERLKSYANSKGIKIIGDIPIYVAEDSADAWAHDEILQLDECRRPIKVAGCPPDYFSPKGQLWGNPLYNWDNLRDTAFEWWTLRIKNMLKICDIVRIDHFRAFSAYYSIPFGDEDATGGKWEKGPGEYFFDVLKALLGENPPIIAEDLGLIDDGVRSLLKYTGFPGMKVLQFAFNPDGSSDYLPHKYERNCVAYLGTHDNDTTRGWLESENGDNVEFAREYMCLFGSDGENRELIKGLMSSIADTVIITMQDIMELGSEARMNTPSRGSGNWCWRMGDNKAFYDETADWLNKAAKIYGR